MLSVYGHVEYDPRTDGTLCGVDAGVCAVAACSLFACPAVKTSYTVAHPAVEFWVHFGGSNLRPRHTLAARRNTIEIEGGNKENRDEHYPTRNPSSSGKPCT